MGRRQRKPTIVDVDATAIEELLNRAKAGQPLGGKDLKLAVTIIESYVVLFDLLKQGKRAIGRLRKLVFGASTEKTSALIGNTTDGPPSSQDNPTDSNDKPNSDHKPSSPPKGHGRNGADAYRGAKQIKVPHESLQAGNDCPDCKRGTVYEMAHPGVLVRVVGQAPVQATVYKLQKLRCNLCGKVFTAQPPAGVGSKKYDATVASMIGLLKYGSGMPFNRLGGLQGNLEIPLPASTQWDIVHAVAKKGSPVYQELIRQAAQGDVLHNDDTTIKILELMGKRAKQKALDSADASTAKDGPERTGMFTSGVVSTREGRRIALFFSGRQHAGENLKDVLAQRAKDLDSPIQMCDGLSRNLPGELKTILANCLVHSRRYFVDVVDSFPEECRHVFEALKVVYKNDAKARERKLSPEERLHFHRVESGPVMEQLHGWLNQQFDQRLVEPNSVLGQAITYMLKRWQELTLFLREAGAPLDNNLVERALKKSILHRKNALFFKTKNGARVGDLFMSLIYTCELCGANPFDYLTELQRNAEVAAAHPEHWLPWNYREALEAARTAA